MSWAARILHSYRTIASGGPWRAFSSLAGWHKYSLEMEAAEIVSEIFEQRLRLWSRYQKACQDRSKIERALRDMTHSRDQWRVRAEVAEARLKSAGFDQEISS